MVRDENLKFMKNRDVYSSDYFSFVLSLASLNAVSTSWVGTEKRVIRITILAKVFSDSCSLLVVSL